MLEIHLHKTYLQFSLTPFLNLPTAKKSKYSQTKTDMKNSLCTNMYKQFFPTKLAFTFVKPTNNFIINKQFSTLLKENRFKKYITQIYLLVATSACLCIKAILRR